MKQKLYIAYLNNAATGGCTSTADLRRCMQVHENMIIFWPSYNCSHLWSIIFLQTFNIEAGKSIMVYSSTRNKTEQSHTSNNEHLDEYIRYEKHLALHLFWFCIFQLQVFARWFSSISRTFKNYLYVRVLGSKWNNSLREMKRNHTWRIGGSSQWMVVTDFDCETETFITFIILYSGASFT